jgi:transcriptional regulator with XRE-family HTH domain
VERRPPADIRQALGQAVRSLRTDRRLTQEQLADLAGIHAHYVSDIERGIRNVAIVNLTYLAGAFGLTAAELLSSAGL